VPIQPSSRPEPRPQLLIVDDDAAVLDVTRSMARAIGCHALVADNGRHALELFREHSDRIHAVLVDLNMPRLDGVELIRLIREHRPATFVMLMTGDTVDDARVTAAGISPDYVLIKPFTLDGLKTALFGDRDQAQAA
jgi:DNA-binding response OmpR family regulator